MTSVVGRYPRPWQGFRKGWKVKDRLAFAIFITHLVFCRIDYLRQVNSREDS